MVLRPGDAAGMALVPRSEIFSRLHRPYKEKETTLVFPVTYEALVMSRCAYDAKVSSREGMTWFIQNRL
jgi:hypothetical protein